MRGAMRLRDAILAQADDDALLKGAARGAAPPNERLRASRFGRSPRRARGGAHACARRTAARRVARTLPRSHARHAATHCSAARACARG
jgi:hypothetical protein